MRNLKINYIAVLACVLLNMVISGFWYSIFTEIWLNGHGLTEEIIKENLGTSVYIIAFIANLISMYVLAWLFVKMEVESPIRGALTGLLIGIAFYFVVLYSQNSFALKPASLNFVDGGVNVLCWTIAGAILGAWTKYYETES